MAKRKRVQTIDDVAEELPSKSDLALIHDWLIPTLPAGDPRLGALRRVFAAAQLAGMQHVCLLGLCRYFDNKQHVMMGPIHREAKQLVGFVKPKEKQ